MYQLDVMFMKQLMHFKQSKEETVCVNRKTGEKMSIYKDRLFFGAFLFGFGQMLGQNGVATTPGRLDWNGPENVRNDFRTTTENIRR